MKTLAVVGGGPAGLRAAEVAAERGVIVHVFDAMPSVGRKFLVAGRGGLNITNSESPESFGSRYSTGFPHTLLEAFGPEHLRLWVEDLGVSTFIGSGRRVYPEGMKAAPLLRRWISRLRSLGVTFHPRHRWTGFRRSGSWTLEFTTPEGPRTLACEAAVFALGGASWPQTGSNAGWVDSFAEAGVSVHPFTPSNCGWDAAWSPEFIERAEGKPLKNITAQAGANPIPGELLITRSGLEGGPIYALTPLLRLMTPPVITIDLKPALTEADLIARLAHTPRLHFHEAFERWKLDHTARALIECHPLRAEWTSSATLAAAVKACPIPLLGPRPLAEAISSAGGVAWDSVDQSLMLKNLPGLFVAGEMLDWETPTGGYLMQGCFSTGTKAGLEAAAWLS